MFLRVAVIAASLATPVAAQAETDWSIAAKTWSEQLQELRLADAARRLCGLQASPAVVSDIRITLRGLEQALRPAGESGRAGEVVAAAGGKRKFCADTGLMVRARATLASLAAAALPENPSAAPVPPATAPTPVVDPDVPLIRGCRDAVNRALGTRRTNDKAFWSKYEACVSDQGAGWY